MCNGYPFCCGLKKKEKRPKISLVLSWYQKIPSFPLNWESNLPSELSKVEKMEVHIMWKVFWYISFTLFQYHEFRLEFVKSSLLSFYTVNTGPKRTQYLLNIIGFNVSPMYLMFGMIFWQSNSKWCKLKLLYGLRP